jgi:hypothetical protein
MPVSLVYVICLIVISEVYLQQYISICQMLFEHVSLI